MMSLRRFLDEFGRVFPDRDQKVRTDADFIAREVITGDELEPGSEDFEGLVIRMLIAGTAGMYIVSDMVAALGENEHQIDLISNLVERLVAEDDERFDSAIDDWILENLLEEPMAVRRLGPLTRARIDTHVI